MMVTLHVLKITRTSYRWNFHFFFGVAASIKKLIDNLKIRFFPACYELEAILLKLNNKFDKVSGYIHVELRNHYSFKDKLKLSLNFWLAANQKKIGKNRLFGENKKIEWQLLKVYISILMIFNALQGHHIKFFLFW